MKRFIGLIISVVLVAGLFGQAMTDGRLTGILPQDGNRNGIQMGRYLQFYDGDITAVSHIDDGTFTTGTPWTATDDWDITDNVAIYEVSGTSSTGSITQDAADMAIAFRGSQYVKMSYTVKVDEEFSVSTPASVVSGICSEFTASLTDGDHVYYFTTLSGAADSSFVWEITPDASETAGLITVDDLVITNYYESPVTLTYGESLTLTTPTNGVELVLDPVGYDLSIVNNSAYFTISTVHAIPTTKDDEVVIRNDSGSTITVYFYYTII